MTVTAPESALRARLIEVLNTEFEGDSIGFTSDKLNESLGQNGALGGVYPGPAQEMMNQGLVLEVTSYVQLFHQWNPKVDPNQAVDPSLIETDAERIRRAVQAADATTPGNAHLWYYRVTKIEYPPDPTGNISRLLATVVATSQNASLVETSG